MSGGSGVGVGGGVLLPARMTASQLRPTWLEFAERAETWRAVRTFPDDHPLRIAPPDKRRHWIVFLNDVAEAAERDAAASKAAKAARDEQRIQRLCDASASASESASASASFSAAASPASVAAKAKATRPSASAATSGKGTTLAAARAKALAATLKLETSPFSAETAACVRRALKDLVNPLREIDA